LPSADAGTVCASQARIWVSISALALALVALRSLSSWVMVWPPTMHTDTLCACAVCGARSITTSSIATAATAWRCGQRTSQARRNRLVTRSTPVEIFERHGSACTFPMLRAWTS
jgi:hypothetical protein